MRSRKMSTCARKKVEVVGRVGRVKGEMLDGQLWLGCCFGMLMYKHGCPDNAAQSRALRHALPKDPRDACWPMERCTRRFKLFVRERTNNWPSFPEIGSCYKQKVSCNVLGRAVGLVASWCKEIQAPQISRAWCYVNLFQASGLDSFSSLTSVYISSIFSA